MKVRALCTSQNRQLPCCCDIIASYPSASSAPGLSKAPWGDPTTRSTYTSSTLSHPLPAKPPPTSFPPGSSRLSLPTQPHTPMSLTKSASTVTGAWRLRSSGTTTTTPTSLSYRLSSVSCRLRSTPAPSRSMPAITASPAPMLGSALLRYRPWGWLIRVGSTSVPPTCATASLAVGGQQPNEGVMSLAPQSSHWPDEAWVRRGANQSPDTDRWFAMTRYSRFVT